MAKPLVFTIYRTDGKWEVESRGAGHESIGSAATVADALRLLNRHVNGLMLSSTPATVVLPEAARLALLVELRADD